jgi:hypothetical protein
MSKELNAEDSIYTITEGDSFADDVCGYCLSIDCDGCYDEATHEHLFKNPFSQELLNECYHCGINLDVYLESL